MRLVVWGAGELGGRVVAAWDGPVLAVTRGESRHEALRAAGAEVATGVPALRDDDVLLLAVPGAAAQAEAIDALDRIPERAVLISSTGYHAGSRTELIAATTPPGNTPRARAIAEVERSWPGIVLRCGGLYRPGRGPFSALVRRGAPPPGPPDKSLALIHYDDAAAAALAALLHAAPERCYLAVTPPCPTREDFYREACDRLGLPAPTFDAPLGLTARFDVETLRRDLLPEPSHPDWRSALE